MGQLAYFSSASGNTDRFIHRLGHQATRIPRNKTEDLPSVLGPFVLITPTFADGEGHGAVPKQVIRFKSPYTKQKECPLGAVPYCNSLTRSRKLPNLPVQSRVHGANVVGFSGGRAAS
ncbi:class Ib ribonucleoside-diphosphate reductase assembly flavoprotein NrdI [Roseibium sp. TrichSKD4]|uniref:class Ib ribonucleoside-diphosphate reductase assembly flavoprotein NrdI n=1 Tax=Roseibium sp. TrichSKD4 TaxID=744980 RepID=UPI000A0110A5|nr:class Ib ribonucleoside-diphosphate reductase assembly flavoprotein NrdI [Roseibium sp. TrichSKD4]